MIVIVVAILGNVSHLCAQTLPENQDDTSAVSPVRDSTLTVPVQDSTLTVSKQDSTTEMPVITPAVSVIIDTTAFSYPLRKPVGVITGKVHYELSGAPATGVILHLQNTVLWTSVDSSGAFRIPNVPLGKYRLNLSGEDCESTTTLVTLSRNVNPVLALTVRVRTDMTGNVNITANKTFIPTSPRAISAVTVPASEIAARNAYSVEQAISVLDGLQMNGSHISIRSSSGVAIGSGSNVLLLVDGLPYVSIDDGGISSEGLPVYAASSIELVKCANSGLYGAGAVGGIVNVITRPIIAGDHGSIHLYSGFYMPSLPDSGLLLSRTADVTNALGADAYWSRTFDKIGFLVSGSVRRDAGEDSRIRLGVYGKLAWSFDPHSDLNLFASLASDNNYSSIDLFSLDSAVLRSADQPYNKFYRGHLSLGLRARRFVDRSFAYTIQGNFLHTFLDENGDPFDPMRRSSSSNNLYFETQFLSTLNRYVRFSYGLAASLNGITSNLYGDHDIRRGGVYGHIEFGDRSEILADVGARFDMLSSFDSTLADEFEFSPRIAIIYYPDESTSLRLVASRGFRPPTVAQQYPYTTFAGKNTKANPLLRPERVWHAEIGGRNEGHALEGVLSLSGDCAFFLDEYYSLIEPVYDPGDKLVYYDNINRARVLGIDASVSGLIEHPNIRFKLGMITQSGHSLQPDLPLTERPAFIAYSTATWHHGPFSATLDYHHIEQPSSPQPTTLLAIPAYSIQGPVNALDLHIQYEAANLYTLPITFSLDIRNLLNVVTLDGSGNNTFTRTIELGARMKF